MTPYRERAIDDTQEHIRAVHNNIETIAIDLVTRGNAHDRSKFEEVELGPLAEMKEVEDREGPVEFGTPEYSARTAMLGDMWKHHVEHNDHHPEHFQNGIAGMNLMQIVEMLCDWQAASEQRDPSKTMNITFCVEKYGISADARAILSNTADSLGWKHK